MFSNNEYCDTYFLFGKYAGNASEAARQYAVQYPNRRLPDKNVILRLDHRMRTTGRLEPLPRELGRPRSTKTVAGEKAILEEVQNHPTISIRELSRNLKSSTKMTEAKAFAKNAFINQERMLEVRRRSDTALVLTINDAS
ncbi:hypothetical protein TcasGA2_TC004250 [Tribolium castaneum]|uniref:DUF4817 domain-containing protein n=1 Tax=Tribolium castaneum TaxID=7070 RepID=D7EKK6_TRICA|nr:hypothetical protein TcasGA2_TC004250 [Tribolium castaneum]